MVLIQKRRQRTGGTGGVEPAGHELGDAAVDEGLGDPKDRLPELALAAGERQHGPDPDDLVPCRLRLPAEKLHDAIAHAALLVGDSATMSTEAAVLGVPSVFINENRLGYIREMDEKYGLVKHFMSDKKGCEAALEAALSILQDESRTTLYRSRRDGMLGEKKNMTKIMVRIVEQLLKERDISQTINETVS